MFNSIILINKNKLVLGSFKVKNYHFFKIRSKFSSYRDFSNSQKPFIYFDKSFPLSLHSGIPLEIEDWELIQLRILYHLELTDGMSLIDYEHIMGKLAIYITDDEFLIFPSDEKYYKIRESIRAQIISQRFEVSVDPNKIYTPREFYLLNDMQQTCIARVHGFVDEIFAPLMRKFSSPNYVPNGINVKPGTYKTKSDQREIIKAILEARNGHMGIEVFCQIVDKLVVNITDADLLLIPEEYLHIRNNIRRLADIAKFEVTIWTSDPYSKSELRKMVSWKVVSIAKAHGIKHALANSLIKGNEYVIQQLMPIMRRIAAEYYQVTGEFPENWDE